MKNVFSGVSQEPGDGGSPLKVFAGGDTGCRPVKGMMTGDLAGGNELMTGDVVIVRLPFGISPL